MSIKNSSNQPNNITNSVDNNQYDSLESAFDLDYYIKAAMQEEKFYKINKNKNNSNSTKPKSPQKIFNSLFKNNLNLNNKPKRIKTKRFKKNNWKILSRIEKENNRKIQIQKLGIANNTLSMLSLLKKIVFITPQKGIYPLHSGHVSNQSYLYNYNSFNQYKHSKWINYLNHILNHFFGTFYALISKPLFLFSQNKLVIYMNYFIPKTPNKLKSRHFWKYNKTAAVKGLDWNNELKLLINLLSKLLNLKVELKMNQLKYPYMDSHILAKFIALNTNKTAFHKLFTMITQKMITTKTSISDWGFKFRKFNLNSNILEVDKIDNSQQFLTIPTLNYGRRYKKTVSIHSTNPAILTGIRVKVSGRLLTQRVKPKKTINLSEKGGFKKTKKSIVDYALYTNKNKRGAYTVKVWTTSTIHSII